MGTEILTYIPNIIGYLRILLIFAATCFFSQPLYFIVLYSTSAILDGLDGFAARKLNQMSTFGAWFDVVIDLVGRGILWCYVCRHWGYFVIALEWITFTSTHSRGAGWKSSFEEAPWFVQKVMAKGFKTPMGILAVGSLHILPIWLYGYSSNFIMDYLMLPVTVQHSVLAILTVGRLLCMAVEVYCIADYIAHLLNQPVESL